MMFWCSNRRCNGKTSTLKWVSHAIDFDLSFELELLFHSFEEWMISMTPLHCWVCKPKKVLDKHSIESADRCTCPFKSDYPLCMSLVKTKREREREKCQWWRRVDATYQIYWCGRCCCHCYSRFGGIFRSMCLIWIHVIDFRPICLIIIWYVLYCGRSRSFFVVLVVGSIKNSCVYNTRTVITIMDGIPNVWAIEWITE